MIHWHWWVPVTAIYLALLALAIFHAIREADRTPFGIGIIEAYFTVPLLTVSYLIYWIVALATR